MLQQIRQWAHGWVAWVVIILVAGVFVIWGVTANIDTFFGSDDPAVKVVLKVGHDKFTQPQLDKNLQSVMAEYQQSMAAKGMAMQPEDEARVKSMAEQQIIMESVLNQFAAREGFVVNKEQADAFIARVPQFQEDGQFSLDRYRAFLSSRNQTPPEFLREIQQRLALMQISTAIGGSAIVLPEEMKTAVALIYQTRDIGYLEIDAKATEKDVTVNQTELEAYYNGHHSEFTEPAQATIEYIVLDRAGIAAAVKQEPVPEEALKALYQERIESYTTPETRHIAHILIAVPENATDAERQTQHKKAEELLARLRAGGDFAALAKENSEDPGSADQGGDLGLTTKGTFEPSFDDAAFAAPKGEVVGPVETPFGYHLILVTDIQPAHAQPLDQVRTALTDEWYQNETTKRYDEAVKQLSDMAFQSGNDFSAMVKQFGLTPATMTITEDNAKNTGIGKMPEIIEAAFDKSAFHEKLNSELLQINPDEAVVLRTTELTESHLKPFDSVKEAVQQAAIARKASILADDRAKLIMRGFVAGSPPEFIANEHGYTWKKLEKINRQQQGIPYEILKAAFETPVGDKTVFKIVPTMSGVAVLGVSAIHPGKLPTFSNTDEEQAFNDNLKSQLSEFIARRDFDMVAGYAKKVICPHCAGGVTPPN